MMNHNETKNHGCLSADVARAISQSVNQNEIVTIGPQDGLTEELERECEASALCESVYEFWGVNCDGEAWRVHVRI